MFDDYVPEPGRESLRTSFWLSNGSALQDGQPEELVIREFGYYQFGVTSEKSSRLLR